MTVEIENIIANDAIVKLLHILQHLHKDDCCQLLGDLGDMGVFASCDCQLCKDRVRELRILVDYDPRVAASVEAEVRAAFEQVVSLRGVCMDRVRELGGLSAIAQ